jgi:hypothetical protein
MIPAPIPVNDAERLAALRQLLILDTPPEQRIDKAASARQPRGAHGLRLARRRAEIIQTLGVQRFVMKPVKVRHILESLVQMAPLRAARTPSVAG